MSAYNTISFLPEHCDGCNACMTACATAKTGAPDVINSRRVNSAWCVAGSGVLLFDMRFTHCSVLAA